MEIALKQARGARLHILKVMDEAIQAPRAQISDFARASTPSRSILRRSKGCDRQGRFQIRALTEETGTNIELDDDGTVRISAVANEAAMEAIRRIEAITAEIEVEPHLRRQGCAWLTSAPSSTSCRVKTVWCTSPRSPMPACRTWPTS